ncbi:MED6-domain-containing protein [Butyriboletus roseoflavus]|nr:MED6-domain-containing protein [Butyriboletus roseoflavus]
MDDKELHPEDDYSHRFFIWHEWIQAHGPLTTENVFDYFATSMFYDKQSNNQVLRMQTMHTGTPILNESDELRRFTGIEFALAHASPPSLFIIHKRDRLSPDQVRPLAAYFIINNRIYQSPDVYTLLSNRLLTSLNALQSSLDLLRRHRPDYTPRSGFVWPIIDSSPDTPPKKPDLDVLHTDGPTLDAPEKHKLHGPKKLQNNSLMVYAMRTTAMHSNTTPSRSHPLDHNNTPSASALAAASAQPALTPTPSSQSAPTPKAPSTVPGPQDTAPIKGPVGAGKKKKKRTSPLHRVSTPLTHVTGTSVLVA